MADSQPSLVKPRAFRETFGGSYQSSKAVAEFDPAQHLTPYAATNPSEDFAETFHFYLRHKGKLPKRLQGKPAIISKWEFIDTMTRTRSV